MDTRVLNNMGGQDFVNCQFNFKILFPMRPSFNNSYYLPVKTRLTVLIEYDWEDKYASIFQDAAKNSGRVDSQDIDDSDLGSASDPYKPYQANTKILYTQYGGFSTCWNQISTNFNLHKAQKFKIHVDYRNDEQVIDSAGFSEYALEKSLINKDLVANDLLIRENTNGREYNYVSVDDLRFDNCPIVKG